MNISGEFANRMKKQLGAEGYDSYIASLKAPACRGLRINTAKTDAEEIMRAFPGKLEPKEDLPGAFHIIAEDISEFSRSPLYHAGLYYLQEPSSMQAAASIPIAPEDRVLDLCAAPGGKSTQLWEKLSLKGSLLANDISASRAAGLLKNLELFGAANICVSTEAPEKLLYSYREYFDKILIDAPCSGEGMFRREPKMRSFWEENPPEKYAPLQAEILESAVGMLKNGGLLLYSTCTFSGLENESQINSFLDRHPEFTPVDIEKKCGAVPGCCGLKEAVHLYPHLYRGEGLFFCLLKKRGVIAEKGKEAQKRLNNSVPETVKGFIDEYIDGFPEGTYYELKDGIYFLPDGTEKKDGIRYLRTGLHLGSVEKSRFTPSQALAMYLKKDGYKYTADLELSDPRVLKYLRGESFMIDGSFENGAWVLLCVQGHPLGWLKFSGGIMKNRYARGWIKR